MILNTHRNRSPRLAKARLGFMTSAAALIAVLAIYSGPRLVLAQTQTPTPAPASPAPAAPGALVPAPKLKPGETAGMPGMPAAPAPAALPQAPLAPLPPAAGAVIGQPYNSSLVPVWPPVPSPVAVPVPPPAPPQGTSIEERLDRLERMVQKLLAQQGPKHPRTDAQDLAPEVEYQPPSPKGKDLKDWKDQLFDPQQMELLRERIKREVAPAIDQALREAARATEQAKRAYEQAQRAAKQAADPFLRADQNEDDQDYDQGQNPFNKDLAAFERKLAEARAAFERKLAEARAANGGRNSFNKDLAALQSRREALQQELQKLIEQISRLKKDQELKADLRLPRDESNPAQPKPESTPSGKAETK